MTEVEKSAVAIAALREIASTRHGVAGGDPKTGRRSKDAIITLARETCDKIGVIYTRDMHGTPLWEPS